MKGLILTYSLTYGGAIVSLFKPFYGLLVYVAFGILRPEMLWPWAVPPGNYSRTVAIALLTGWVLNGFGDWQLGKAKPIVWALVAYLAWQVLSGLQAANPAVTWRQVELQTKIVLPFVVGVTLIDSVSKLLQLVWVMVLCMGYVAFEANISYWAGNNWLRESGFGSMDNNSICIGMVAVAGMAFFLGLGEREWWKKSVAFGCAAFMAHAPMFGDSRGGMLGLLVTGVVAFFLIPKEPKHYAWFLVAVLVAARLAGPSVIERFQTAFAGAETRDESAQSRLDLWTDCWDVMQKHPLLGLGPDHWPLTAESYGWRAGKECHSLWFNAGAELGFPGLAFLLAFYLTAIRHSWWMSRRVWQDPWFADLGRMVVAAVSGFMVSASFVSLDNLEPPYYIVLIAAGAAKLCTDRPSASLSEARDRVSTRSGIERLSASVSASV